MAFRRGLIRSLGDPAVLGLLVGVVGLFLAGLRGTNEWLFPYRWWFIASITLGLLAVAARATWIPHRKEHYCLYAVIAVSAISCLVSPMPEYSFARLATFMLMFFAVFIAAWLWFQNESNVWIVVSLLVLTAIIGAVASVYYVWEQGSVLPSARVSGAFERATAAGSFAAGSLPLVLWMWQYSRGRWRLFYGAILGILAYLLVFSGARAALIGGTAAACVWFWKHRPLLRPILTAGGLAGLILLLIGVITPDMLPSYVVRKESLATFTGRIPLWQVGMDLFWKSPAIGHGYGMTRYVRRCEDGEGVSGQIVPGPFNIVDLLPGGARPRLGRATLHSDHVERLVETGIVGFVPFALFWYFLLRRVAGVFRGPPDLRRSLAMALALNVVYLFLDSFMHGAMFAINAPGAVMAWLVIVLFMAVSDRALHARGRSGAPCLTESPSPRQPLA